MDALLPSGKARARLYEMSEDHHAQTKGGDGEEITKERSALLFYGLSRIPS
jgi:hypothetical protein